MHDTFHFFTSQPASENLDISFKILETKYAKELNINHIYLQINRFLDHHCINLARSVSEVADLLATFRNMQVILCRQDSGSCYSGQDKLRLESRPSPAIYTVWVMYSRLWTPLLDSSSYLLNHILNMHVVFYSCMN